MAQEETIERLQHDLRARGYTEVLAVPFQQGIHLSGRVPSHADRQQVLALAQQAQPDVPITNELEVQPLLPNDAQRFAAEDLAASQRPESVTGMVDARDDLNPLFSGEPLESNVLAAEDGGLNDQDPVEEDSVYFPPTDPVITAGADGELEVLGGFDTTAMQDADVAPSTLDRTPGDEALADAVRRELREDAQTTDLVVAIEVDAGVVTLRGRVASLEDAEAAEAVAERVPGVRAVTEELDVAGM